MITSNRRQFVISGLASLIGGSLLSMAPGCGHIGKQTLNEGTSLVTGRASSFNSSELADLLAPILDKSSGDLYSKFVEEKVGPLNNYDTGTRLALPTGSGSIDRYVIPSPLIDAVANATESIGFELNPELYVTVNDEVYSEHGSSYGKLTGQGGPRRDIFVKKGLPIEEMLFMLAHEVEHDLPELPGRKSGSGTHATTLRTSMMLQNLYAEVPELLGAVKSGAKVSTYASEQFLAVPDTSKLLLEYNTWHSDHELGDAAAIVAAYGVLGTSEASKRGVLQAAFTSLENLASPDAVYASTLAYLPSDKQAAADKLSEMRKQVLTAISEEERVKRGDAYANLFLVSTTGEFLSESGLVERYDLQSNDEQVLRLVYKMPSPLKDAYLKVVNPSTLDVPAVLQSQGFMSNTYNS